MISRSSLISGSTDSSNPLSIAQRFGGALSLRHHDGVVPIS
jgi:hypothetical protein